MNKRGRTACRAAVAPGLECAAVTVRTVRTRNHDDYLTAKWSPTADDSRNSAEEILARRSVLRIVAD